MSSFAFDFYMLRANCRIFVSDLIKKASSTPLTPMFDLRLASLSIISQLSCLCVSIAKWHKVVMFGGSPKIDGTDK